jgi:methylthioribose-1-phosphate isomerase
MTLTAIKYDEEEHVLSLLDQRALPATTTYIQCTTSHQVTALLPIGQLFGRITQKG